MDEIKVDTSSDIHFLENEKFDFDLPFSPTLAENKIEKKESVNNNDGDDEVFFGSVGFTEQCMSTQVTSLQTDSNLKPLSPLSGEQVVELFTEATKLALHIERLSTKTSDTSLNQSHASSGRSSLSNSYLKFSNCSSSSSSMLQFSFEKFSSGSSDGKPSQSEILDIDKENTQPTTVQGTKRQGGKDEKTRKVKEAVPLVSKQNNTPVVKQGLPRPGSRGSRLPKSKNTEKSCSAFNSPIKQPEVTKTDHLETRNLAKMKAQSISKTTRRRSEHNIQKSVPTKATSTTNNARKTSVTTLAKRNIFRSTESLTEVGTKQTKSRKLPVPDRSKIPGPRPRRRRSSSTSSISSQSSTSSSQSQPALEECRSVSTRKAKAVPSTKASLASSLPLGLIRRSNKQENSNDKKPQPMKVLPRSAKIKTSDGQAPTSTQPPKPMPQAPPSRDEPKDDKTPLPATPRLPVARRRSNIRRPSSSSTRSSDGSPARSISRTKTTNCQTPQSRTEQIKKNEPSLACDKRRRSFIPTPGRSTRTSKSTSENPQLLSFSPAVNTKEKPNSKEKIRAENVSEEHDENQNVIDTITSAQSVDDLLQLDDAVAAMPDVISLQPNPIPQLDLIDLS